MPMDITMKNDANVSKQPLATNDGDCNAKESGLSRRDAAIGLFSAMGITALSACTERDADSDLVSDTVDPLTNTTFCWVDNMAALRAVSHPASGTTDSKVSVLEGYYAIGDGGGGVFVWDYSSASSTVENNGTVIRPSDIAAGQSGRWRRVYSGALNVKWFGAKGDGASADAAAIQETVNVASAGDGVVQLPAGSFFTGATTITTPTTSGAKLRITGAGKRLTRITRTSTSATHTFDIMFTGPSVVAIGDLTVDGPSALALHNNSIGINWSTSLGDTSHSLRLERVEVTGKHDTAVENSGGGRLELIDCDLEGTDTCVAMFSSVALPDGGGAFLLARGGTWKTPNGDLSTLGTVGLYIHPHIPYDVSDVTFSTIGRYGIYQNGTWTDSRSPAVATGCRFINCEMAQTKGNGVSDFAGCVLRGTSSNLGSTLNGRVNISGCTFESGASVNYGAGTFSKVNISGSLFVDTPMGTGGSAGNRWSIRDTTIVVTDNAPGWLGMSCADGITDLYNVNFVDETTTNSYLSFIRMTVTNSAPIVTVKGCRFRDGRNTNAGIYMTLGTLTVEDCEFTAGTTAEAIWVTAALGANVLDGENNRFLNGAYVFVATSGQQRMVRRRSANPNTVASATNMNSSSSTFAHYDTHVLTGSAAIQSLTQTAAFVGIVRLVVAAGGSWSTANTGNIAPKTTAPRSPGAVVELLWEPIASKWLEV